MNRLNTAKRVQVLAALVDGSSINAIIRMTGIAKHTVLKLIEDIDCACAAYHHRDVRALRSISCTTAFVSVHKTLRVTPAMEAGLTDHVWTLEELIDTLHR